MIRLTVLLLLFSVNVFAQDVRTNGVLTCGEPPTKREDGTDITGRITYRFYENDDEDSFLKSFECAATQEITGRTLFFSVTAQEEGGGPESLRCTTPVVSGSAPQCPGIKIQLITTTTY